MEEDSSPDASEAEFLKLGGGREAIFESVTIAFKILPSRPRPEGGDSNQCSI